MKLLAFDLATQTGVAFGEATGTPTAATEVLGVAGQPHGARFLQCFRMVKRYVRDFDPDVIALEQAIAFGPVGDASRVQMAMGFRAAVLAVAHGYGIDTIELSVSTIRRHFIGGAHIPSAEAKQAVWDRCKMLGWKARNFDESDAMAVWEAARGELKVKNITTPPGGLFGA